MGRWRRPPKKPPTQREVRDWHRRAQVRWLPGTPDDSEAQSAARKRRRPRRKVFDPGDPPPGWSVEPAVPDGWCIRVRVRKVRSLTPRVFVGLGLVLLTVLAAVFEPLAMVLPGFALLAFLFVVLIEETGPGAEVVTELSLGSAGVRVGDVHVTAPQVRDVFWKRTQPGEMALGIRGPDHETEVMRVPTAPEFANGLSEEQREWLAEALRAVGRSNRGRSGTEADIPDALRARLAKRRPEG